MHFNREVSWKAGQPPLLPVVARAVAQVRGLGLVQREELLPRALHGPRQLRDAPRVQDVRGSHAAG